MRGVETDEDGTPQSDEEGVHYYIIRPRCDYERGRMIHALHTKKYIRRARFYGIYVIS